jgi:geranylgeranyl pyrophosphate synthase
MELSAYCAALRARIDAEFSLRLAERFPRLGGAERAAVQDVLAGGKRLRGTLTCLLAQALDAPLERALPGALAVELVQAASLVHDDFVDGDKRRRGRAAAWTVVSPRRAVLIADVMFAVALESMALSGSREGATLAQAIAAMAQGALAELAHSNASPSAAAYRRLIELKTGSLFAAAARVGALAADAAPRVLEAAAQFGMLTGVLYQMADDVADGDAPSALAANEMERLGEQARVALAVFPQNAHTALLAELPAGLICVR